MNVTFHFWNEKSFICICYWSMLMTSFYTQIIELIVNISCFIYEIRDVLILSNTQQIMKYCELPFTKKWESLSDPINVVDEETNKEQVVDSRCVPHIREIMQNGLHSFGCKPFTSFSSLDHNVMFHQYTSQFFLKLVIN